MHVAHVRERSIQRGSTRYRARRGLNVNTKHFGLDEISLLDIDRQWTEGETQSYGICEGHDTTLYFDVFFDSSLVVLRYSSFMIEKKKI